MACRVAARSGVTLGTGQVGELRRLVGRPVLHFVADHARKAGARLAPQRRNLSQKLDRTHEQVMNVQEIALRQ